MNNKAAISDIYRVIGLLEGLTMMQGQTITEGVAIAIGDCLDRLELLGNQLLAKDVQDDEERRRAYEKIIP